MLIEMNPETVEKITRQGLIAAFEVCDDPTAQQALALSIRHFSTPSQWQEFKRSYD